MGDDLMFKDWLKLVPHISLADDGTLLKCPICNSIIEYQYVGDINTRVGYLDIWCPSCLNGIHISRVSIPPEMDFISFEDIDKIENRIPNYVQIPPV